MTLTEIQQALAVLDTQPRQSLGQNFLHDQNVAQWIVAQAHVEPGDHVVEIGPGLGSLTEFAVRQAGHLTLIEKDGRMVEWLSRKYTPPQVELFHTDALEFDLRKLHGKGPVKLIGNLPYYVSTPLIAKYTSALSPASILVLTLQYEVAVRLNAQPRTKDYGAMTVCTARRWNVRFLKKLPPQVFHPAPRVSSAVVVFTRRPASEVPPCNEVLFDDLVRKGFSERRKQLRNLLPEYRAQWDAICRQLSVPETVRAEELSLAQWESLTNLVSPMAAQSGSEMFDVVDENDRVTGSEPRDVVHVNNLRHRAVHILLFNAAGELFLQKRSLWKDRNPGLWDSSAAGHVDAGETYETAATRELAEELGVDGCRLEKAARLSCSAETGWEFIDIFRGVWDGPFRLAPMEVETGAFFPLPQIRDWIKTSPQEFSPVFRAAFAAVEGLGGAGR